MCAFSTLELDLIVTAIEHFEDNGNEVLAKVGRDMIERHNQAVRNAALTGSHGQSGEGK